MMNMIAGTIQREQETERDREKVSEIETERDRENKTTFLRQRNAEKCFLSSYLSPNSN